MRKEFVATGKTLDEAIANVCALANTTIDNLDSVDVLETGKSGFLGFGRRDFKVVAYVEQPDEPAAAAPEKPTTFGKKKSKREKFEEKAAKQAKKNQDIDIRPIVTAEPDPERAAAEEEKRERRPRRERDRKPRAERPERERAERPRPERAERPERADRADRAERERRRDSHAVNVTEGEMADRLYADARAFLDPIFAKLGVEPEITPQVREGILWLVIRGADLGILIGRRGETLNSLQYLVNLAVNKRRHEHARLVLDVEGYREGREETLTALARKMAEKAVRSGRRVELEPMNPHERRVVHIALQEDKRVDTISHGEEPYRRVVINPKNRRSRGRKAKTGMARPESAPGAVSDNLTAENEAVLVMPAENLPETVTSIPAPAVETAPVSAPEAVEAAPVAEAVTEAAPVAEAAAEAVVEAAPEPAPNRFAQAMAEAKAVTAEAAPAAEAAAEAVVEATPEPAPNRFAQAMAEAKAVTAEHFSNQE